MSLRLYIDDSSFRRRLVQELRAAGHEVVIPQDAQLTGAADTEHFEYARLEGLVLLTQNPADFLDLHERQPDHSGLLLIYRDNDPSRDMTAGEIVRAIGNLVAVGLSLHGQAHVLNQWRY